MNPTPLDLRGFSFYNESIYLTNDGKAKDFMC